jgi:hypothetical protein
VKTFVSSITKKLLHINTAEQYMLKAMTVFKAIHGHAGGTAASIAFFKDIEANPGKSWLYHLIHKAKEEQNRLKKELGEKLEEHKSPPLETATFLQCIDVLMMKNTAESITNSLMLSTQRSECGRAGELKDFDWEDIEVREHARGERIIVCADFQEKVRKVKTIPLLPACDDPRLDFCIHLGDFMAAEQGHVPCPQNTLTRHKVFPKLAGVQSASVVVTVS